MSTDLSVLFATRNGELVVCRTLEGYCRVEKPALAWKIVVVDNGSDDHTPDLVASFKNRLPLELLSQPAAGKNRALNLGLNAVEGGLVIITDDDAIPDRSFLSAWSKYVNGEWEYELFGGSIDLTFDAAPPKWMLQNKSQLNMLFSYRDLPEGPISANEIYGPNMAVRTSVFERGFRFDENIGPNGSDALYPMGSEAEFCCRIERGGVKAWFAEEPRVRHIVRGHQLERSYWAKRSYRHGRGEAQRRRKTGQDPPADLSRPHLREKLRMFSPSPLQRFLSVCAHHERRGFRDEWTKGQVLSRGPGQLL